MKQHRPRISSELFERVMTDSTGVSHQDCSFEIALNRRLFNDSVEIAELQRKVCDCSYLIQTENDRAKLWIDRWFKSNKSRMEWKGIAITTFIGWLLTLAAFGSLM